MKLLQFYFSSNQLENEQEGIIKTGSEQEGPKNPRKLNYQNNPLVIRRFKFYVELGQEVAQRNISFNVNIPV